MHFIVYGMILSVLLAEFLQGSFGLPRQLRWIPEIMSLLAALIVIARLPINQFKDVNPRYLFVFGLLFLHLIAGVIANELQPGVIFAGIRFYLKSVPFFFLPLVLKFEDRHLKRQLLLLGLICVIQLPIAWEQRATTAFGGGLTGDETVGTLGVSSHLSIFLCAEAAVAMALHLKGRLSLKSLVIFFALTLPATMINETKATLFLLPLALLIPAILSAEGAVTVKLKRSLVAISLIGAFLAAFIPVYDYFIAPRWGYGILEFFTMEGRVERYLMKDATIGSDETGRIDALVLPFVASQADPIQITLGLGIANVSQSFLGEGFTGEYFVRYGRLVGPSASLLLWEIGWVGTALVFWLFYLIFRDALVARAAGGLEGAIALGWTGVVVLIFIGLFYKNVLDSNALTYLFWFYSGVVAAAATRIRQAAPKASNVRPMKDTSRFSRKHASPYP